MQLRIVHTTGYEYDGQATASYNEARLTPVTSAEQIVVHTRLEVSPTPWTYTYRDYFGSQVTSFEVLDPHASLRVTSIATVHTNRPPPSEPKLTWSEIRSRQVTDRHNEFLVVTPMVQADQELLSRVRAIAASSALPGTAAVAVCDLINGELEYRRGSTGVLTPAAEAWQQRAGVCQDIAHVVVGALRSIGIPARYVSGYLHPSKDAIPGETVTGESHAWVEWWDDAWCGFDPTNDEPIGDRHVVIATGREYADVRPLGGIYRGGVTSSMFVNVEVTRLA